MRGAVPACAFPLSGFIRTPKLTTKNAENAKREKDLVTIPGGRFLTLPLRCQCLLFVFFAFLVVTPFRKSGLSGLSAGKNPGRPENPVVVEPGN